MAIAYQILEKTISNHIFLECPNKNIACYDS